MENYVVMKVKPNSLRSDKESCGYFLINRLVMRKRGYSCTEQLIVDKGSCAPVNVPAAPAEKERCKLLCGRF